MPGLAMKICERCNIAIPKQLVSSFYIFLPLLVSPALSVFLYAVAPGTGGGQDSPTKERQEGTVQAQIRNVTVHFSETVAVEIKSLKGELVPLGKMSSPSSTTKIRLTCA